MAFRTKLGATLLVLMGGLVAPSGQALATMEDGWCLSGGPGASSCSINIPLSSCSVECAGGSYACCSVWSICVCVSEE